MTTNLGNLDELISSFDKTNLYVIAGRPGVGKTTLGFTIVDSLRKLHKSKIAIVSYEMNYHQVLARLLAVPLGMWSAKITKGDFMPWEEDYLEREKAKLAEANIFIECPSRMSTTELRSTLKELKQNEGLDFLFLDDIHRITISDEDRKYTANREQEVSKNVRDLKALAKELEISILAISQMNRDNKEREGHRPVLTDIRDSGAIENDADVVLLLYRPEYYGITEDENGNSILGVAELDVAKNRHGAIGMVKLAFRKTIPTFYNLDEFSDGVW